MSVMLLLLPLCIYFSLHVSSRTQYYKDRNFRQLSNFSHQISERIDSLGSAFGNLVEKFVKDNQASNTDLRGIFQRDYLDILKTDGTNLRATSAILKNKTPPDPAQKVNADSDLVLPVTINLVHEEGAAWLYFDYVDSTGNIHFAAKTNFDQLIGPLINQTAELGFSRGEITDEFDHLTIARADNSNVLFESANDDLTLTSLDNIPLADAADKVLNIKTRSKATDSVDITLAGARYKLYAQPIEIALKTTDANDPETLWVICGLVEASRFRDQTWAISHTVLIVSSFFAGLLILSWPFLKLIFIGPKDRLRVAETLTLAVSVVIAASLVTFFFLFGLTYTQMEQTLDGQLYSLADNFQRNFHEEIGNALQQLDTLDSARKQPPESTTSQLHTDQGRSGFEGKVMTSLLQWRCPDGKCKQDPYPYFKTIFWIDENGKQVAKWSISRQTTRKIVVDNRDYFNKLRSGYYHELSGEKFWVEQVTSRNTGSFTVVVSKETEPDKNITNASVVALDTDLASLNKPAMVSGFGYRIIDAKGDVLFPNVKENFFAESENDNRLRSAVSGHLSDFVNVPHLGRDARVYVTPLAGIPEWTLVVFRDKEPLRSSYSEIVALSAALFLIYLFPLVLLLLVVFLISLLTGWRMKWMWPSPDATAIYLLLVPISLLFILVGYLISRRLSSTGAMIALSIISFTALLLLISTEFSPKPAVALTKKLDQKWSWINCRSSYSLCLVALILLIAIFPSVMFFRLAYNEEMDLFIKYGQVTLVKSLNERDEKVRNAYPTNIFANENAARTFIETRLQKEFDCYYQFFFNTTVKKSGANDDLVVKPTPATILSELRQQLPFSRPSSIVRHGLDTNSSADGLWQWPDTINGTLTLLASQKKAKDAGLLNVTSATQRFPVNWPTVLGFAAAMVLLLFFLVRFILNRVFLLDVVQVTEPDAKKDRSLRKLFMVLGSPYTQRDTRFLPVADSEVLNLRNKDADGQWLTTFDLENFLKQASAKPIAIECFEHQIDQPQYNLQKLTFIERLITYEGDVVVTSTAEPADYLFDGIGNTGCENHHTSDASARWARVLSYFWIDYREDNGNPDKFRDDIKERQKDSQNKAQTKLYEELMNECAPRACLQEIGREITKCCDFTTSSSEQLISDILVQAGTYYRLIWESCSPEEKVTLAHLAIDGLLSVNDPDIQRLVRRGLIVRDRKVRLMNESFRQFVLVNCRTDSEVAVTEGKARKSSNWQYMKVALLVVVIGMMVFLFATQRDLYNSTLVALTSIAAGVPAVFNLFNLFQRNGRPATPPPSS